MAKRESPHVPSTSQRKPKSKPLEQFVGVFRYSRRAIELVWTTSKPLTVLIAVGIVQRDDRFTAYVLPLVTLGALIAAYHNLLYYGVIAETLSPCVQGVSCSTRQLELFGFITIPMLSLFAFISILATVLLHRGSRRSTHL